MLKVDAEVHEDFLSLLVLNFVLVDCLVIFLVRYDQKTKSSGLLLVVRHPEHAITLSHERVSAGVSFSVTVLWLHKIFI